MKLHNLIAFAAAALLWPASFAQTNESGFVSIFDGQTLKGWHISAKTGHSRASKNTSGGKWVVENGAIVGSQDIPGNGGIVITDEQYGDFEVALEMNNDFGPDSGLFLRSTEDGKAWQAMIDYHSGGNLMGIYGEGLGGKPSVRNYSFLNEVTQIRTNAAPLALPVLPESWKYFWRHGQWNELRARIVNNPPTITTWINGVKFMEWTETELRHPAKGGIALQVHGGGDFTKQFVRYRNIRVKKLEGAAPTPRANLDNVDIHRDLAYVTGGHERQKLDLYLPRTGDKLPLVIWIHGGAFRAGNKDNPPALRFLSRGIAVASIHYRLSQHAIFPAQMEDCKAAVRWLRKNAAQYRLDPDRFGVWGSSAGGYLAAFLGTASGTREFDVGENLDQSSAVQAACDYFGPTDFAQTLKFESRIDRTKPDCPEALLIGGSITEHPDRVRRANPINYINDQTPPMLIVHGDQDPIVPFNQSELLYEALKQRGRDVQFYPVKEGGHGFRSPEAEQLVNRFFAKHLLVGK